MHISRLAVGQSGPSASNFPGGLPAAMAALNDSAGALGHQLKAYQALAGRWREAGPGERAALAPTLTESPFAQRVQSTLNAFTRAAWAGPDAAPPLPQAKVLEAFDALSEPDREIVAAMQVDTSGEPAYASAKAYRARLQADLETARAPQADRARDMVTLSEEAVRHLAGDGEPASPGIPAPEAAHPAVAAALAAYARVAR
ncbi:MAG: hypothetical protein V4759_02620 [Pseudomonadota bacterium]